ncbi:MAG: hypothetical protein IT261_07890 [Saprospiraceae bacterium]|nr:hypothetical protein [Saprospiraceae bacterium]
MNNDAHLHLVLNHLPILGVLFGLLTMMGGYLLKNPSVKRTALGMFAITFVAALGSMVLAQRVGSSGGEIRHTEIRTGVAAAAGTTAGENANTQEDDD